LFSVHKSLVGKRDLKIRSIPEDLHAKWKQTLERLWRLPKGVIYLSPEAEELQREFALSLERRIGDNGDLNYIADWIGKLQRGQSSRLAAIIHCLEHNDPCNTPVSPATMRRSIGLCKYYLGHAKRAFEMLKPKDDLDYQLAYRLVDFCKDKIEVSFANFSAHTKKKKSELEETVNLLQEHNFLLDHPSKGKSWFKVNPLPPLEDAEEEIQADWEQVQDLPEPSVINEPPVSVSENETENTEIKTLKISEPETETENLQFTDPPKNILDDCDWNYLDDDDDEPQMIKQEKNDNNYELDF
jgi:hypothetical protein